MSRFVLILLSLALSSGATFGQAIRIGGEEPTKGEFVFVGTVESAVAGTASMSEPPRWGFTIIFKDLEMIKGAKSGRMVLSFTTYDDKARVLQAGVRVLVNAKDGRVQSIVEATDEAVRAAGGKPAASAPATTRDWPRFLGPDANGISPETGINKDWKNRPPRVLWEVALSDQGHAGPAVAGGVVYIVDHSGADDVVRAIDINTGRDLWRFAYPESKQGDNGHARATPLVDEGRVYTVSRFGLVHCLDAKTGAEIWSRDVVKDFSGSPPIWGIAMSPVVDGDRLILCPGGEKAPIVALDKATGDTLWTGGGTSAGPAEVNRGNTGPATPRRDVGPVTGKRIETGPATSKRSDIELAPIARSYAGKTGLGYATPVVATLAGRKQYVVFMGLCLIGLDPDTGRELWNFPWPAIQNTATPIVAGEDAVFITTCYERKKACALVKVASVGARAAWENANLASKMATPVLFGGHFYGSNGVTGNLACIDAKTGEIRWQQPGFEHGGLVAVDGVLLALDGKSGDLVMVEMTPERYHEMGRSQPLRYQGRGLRGNVWTAPIVADGKALLRDRNRLVCLDLK